MVRAEVGRVRPQTIKVSPGETVKTEVEIKNTGSNPHIFGVKREWWKEGTDKVKSDCKSSKKISPGSTDTVSFTWDTSGVKATYYDLNPSVHKDTKCSFGKMVDSEWIDKAVTIRKVKILPYKEKIPHACGSEVGRCGWGRNYACAENKESIIARFDTSGFIGVKGKLHFKTGIALYPRRHPEYKVLINGEKVYRGSFDGGGSPYEVTIDFDIRSEETVVKWVNTIPKWKGYTYLIIGTDDCDPNTTESFIEIPA